MIDSSFVVVGREHKAVDFTHSPKFGEWIKGANLRKKPAEILGLHPINGGFAPGNFIGVVRIGECILQVNPKFPQMDYMAMFLHCASHPQVGEHMQKCMDFWPEESPIETDAAPDFCGLVAAAFLRELNELHTRRFRRHFTRESANFTGKAKGKILIAENIRRNTAHLRDERVFCAFQSVSDDILENRILRAALERAVVLIANNRIYEHPILHEWIRAGRAALSGVSHVKIFPSDHKSARQRGAFLHYRRPLRLARSVLESSGFHLHGMDSPEPQRAGVSPFALNSAELFERWAELRLLESGAFSGLRAGYERGNIYSGEDGEIAIRPDFWVAARNGDSARILDAKYRSLPEDGKPSRENIFQMVAYSRHRRFLENRLGAKAEDEVRLSLLYPRIGANAKLEELWTDNSFHAPLSVWTIPCPAKSDAETKRIPAAAAAA